MGRSCSHNFNKYTYRKETFRRPRQRWDDIIRMDLKEIGTHTGNWVDSARDRDYWIVLENAALNLKVPQELGTDHTTWIWPGSGSLYLQSKTIPMTERDVNHIALSLLGSRT
jgi:hypothetical protein